MNWKKWRFWLSLMVALLVERFLSKSIFKNEDFHQIHCLPVSTKCDYPWRSCGRWIILLLLLGWGAASKSALPPRVFFFFFSCVATAGCGWLPYYTLAGLEDVVSKASAFTAWERNELAFFLWVMPRWPELYHCRVIVGRLVSVEDAPLQVSCIPDKTKQNLRNKNESKKRKEQHLSGE